MLRQKEGETYPEPNRLAMGVFLFFVDGLGLGPAGPANPLSKACMPFTQSALETRLVLDGVEGGVKGPLGLVVATDARLGVCGLPQSATGQTALLTGKNAPAIVGRHVNARPTRMLRELLEHNLLRSAKEQGFRVAFLNAYGPDSLQAIARGTYRASATTVAALQAGLRLRDFDDLIRGDALYHDMTHGTLARAGYDVPRRTPSEAGMVARRLASSVDLCFYEFFLTDIAGHQRDEEMAMNILRDIDDFLEALAPGDDLCLVMTSDHGNLEDLSVKGHTLNPVPMVALGGPQQWRSRLSRVSRISDIAPAIMDCMEGRVIG